MPDRTDSSRRRGRPPGNVISVWTRSDGPNFRIQYSTRTPNGNWAAPTTISDPGQSASNPDIAIDTPGNALVAWSRSDGTNIRIQAAFRPAGGSFAAPVTVSDPGFDATKPAIDFDNTGKALVTWQRFDGTKLRVQATIRTAGAGGTFANEATLSEGGQDAFNPQADAGPNVDANGVICWTRSDGVNLRVQSSRRRDVVGFARPEGGHACPHLAGAGLQPVHRVQPDPRPGRSRSRPATRPCASSVLTIGSAGRERGRGQHASPPCGSWSITGNAATGSRRGRRCSDRRRSATSATTRRSPTTPGSVMVEHQPEGHGQPEHGGAARAGHDQIFPFQFAVQCVADGRHDAGLELQHASRRADAVIPGAVDETKRTMWEIGQVIVKDAGPNGTGFAGCPPTCGDGDETARSCARASSSPRVRARERRPVSTRTPAAPAEAPRLSGRARQALSFGHRAAARGLFFVYPGPSRPS